MGRTDLPICISGAALDTGNLGVSALGISVVAALVARLPDARITLFDHGAGHGPLDVHLPDATVRVERRGAWFSKRLYRPESLISGGLQASLGLRRNGNVRAMADAVAVLDISGGDSFSDIYGLERFASVVLPKRLALRLGSPLILLPQTYGPFRGQRARRLAADIVRRSDRAWARDAESMERLCELVGADYDPERHLQAVDVAFALPAVKPDVSDEEGWWTAGSPLVGINVSGLLCNDVDAAKQRFGLIADVMEALVVLVDRFLAGGVRVVLVPHVRGGSLESDDRACQLVQERTDPSGQRVRTLPPGLSASETKWLIAQTDWVIGGRMHATIAALSSSVPVAGIAYSDKFAGVFASCGIGEQALDARTLTTEELVDAAWSGWQRRGEIAQELRDRVPSVVAKANGQFDELVGRLQSYA